MRGDFYEGSGIDFPICLDGCAYSGSAWVTVTKRITIENLHITDTQSPRLLLWDPAQPGQQPAIPIDFADSAPTVGPTSVLITIYSTGNHFLPVRTVELETTGPMTYYWDGMKDGDPPEPAEKGLYTYTMTVYHDEYGWDGAWLCGSIYCGDWERTLSYGGGGDTDVRNSEVTVACTDAQVLLPLPPGEPDSAPGYIPWLVTYRLSGDCSECGLVVYNPDLEIAAQVQTDLPTTGGIDHQRRVDVHIDRPGHYYFVVYGKDKGTNSKDHEPRPILEHNAGPPFTLTGLEVVSGATKLQDGTNTPADTDVCAAVRPVEGDPGWVVLRAKFSPEVGDKAPEGLQWTGGEPVEGKPAQRKVSRAQWAKTPVKAKFGTKELTVLVYVIGAEPTGFSPPGGHFADNEAGYDTTGVFGPTSQSSYTESRCEIQFGVRPLAFVTDGNGGLFPKSGITWDVTREKQVRIAVKDAQGQWAYVPGSWDSGTTWHPDDSDAYDEDNDPWNSAQAHVYGSDRPHFGIEDASVVAVLSRWNMREWVRVTLPQQEQQRCSQYHWWHCDRGVKLGTYGWESDNSFSANEIAVGLISPW